MVIASCSCKAHELVVEHSERIEILPEFLLAHGVWQLIVAFEPHRLWHIVVKLLE